VELYQCREDGVVISAKSDSVISVHRLRRVCQMLCEGNDFYTHGQSDYDEKVNWSVWSLCA
jgi:hypothetical protein